MQLTGFPFSTTDWSKVQHCEHKGERGCGYWRTQHFGDIRVRVIEFTPGYLADHWCTKGHTLLCVEGELLTEFKDGRQFTLTSGTSCQIPDNDKPHRSRTEIGAKLIVID